MVDNSYKIKLTEYFRKNLKKGYPVDTLRIALVNQGYSRATIDESAKEAIRKMAEEAPVIKEKPQIEHEVITEEPIVEKKSWWRRLFGL